MPPWHAPIASTVANHRGKHSLHAGGQDGLVVKGWWWLGGEDGLIIEDRIKLI